VTLTGNALDEARRRGIARIFVDASVSRTDAFAAAVAEGDNDVA
jgi:ABC-type sugar transport system substrate-binding protein